MRHPKGSHRIFTKSGNLVEVLDREKSGSYRGLYRVKRVDGASKGKEMLVPGDALVEVGPYDFLNDMIHCSEHKRYQKDCQGCRAVTQSVIEEARKQRTADEALRTPQG